MNLNYAEEIPENSLIVIPYSENTYLVREDYIDGFVENTDISTMKYCKNQSIITMSGLKNSSGRVCAIDLGAYGELTYQKLRMEYAKTVNNIAPEALKNVVFVIPVIKELVKRHTAEAITEGLLLGAYDFGRYKKNRKELRNNIYLHADCLPGDKESLSEYREGIERGKMVCRYVYMARDLVNEPSNELYPEKFIHKMQEAVKGSSLGIEILDRTGLEKHEMTGVLSVGRGSINNPYMAVLKHTPSKEGPVVALVGKGVTLDLGGINLKTGANLSPVRTDMAGAAAVLAVMRIISELGLKLNVYGIMPLVENVIGANSLKPGEVLEYSNGTTVEIKNTDAEGRLILADGILHAKALGADMIIDIATLTGSVGQALGSKIAGIMGTDTLVDDIIEAGKACGEKYWKLPLEEEYRKALDSDLADISNIGSSEPGVITAALFLKEFVGDVRWAHLDIAAMAFSGSPEGYITKGGTGFGIRTLVRLLEKLCRYDGTN